MGTSQSHILKSGPNWKDAKRSITDIAKGNGDSKANYKSFISNFARAINNGRNSMSKSSSFGTAGARATRKFFSLLNNIQTSSLSDSLGFNDKQLESHQVSKEDFIDRILNYVAGDNDASMDDPAAFCAMEKLLNQILADCTSKEEIEAKLNNASEDEKISWIIDFESEYILEYSGELFQSHIFDKCDNPERVANEIRNWLKPELSEIINDLLKDHHLSSVEGQAILDKLTTDIIEIWKQE